MISKLQHVSDGLIFTSRVEPYKFGTDDVILKWKPPNQNSIDFVIGLEFQNYVDPDTKEAYVDYDSKPQFVLKIWQGDNMYAAHSTMHVTDDEWEQFKDLAEPLEDRVVECYMDDQKRWRYMRFRDDKENGNHWSTCDKVMSSIKDGVTKRELLEACPKIRDNWKRREAAAQRRAAEEQHRRNMRLQDAHKRGGGLQASDPDPKRQKSHS